MNVDMSDMHWVTDPAHSYPTHYQFVGSVLVWKPRGDDEGTYETQRDWSIDIVWRRDGNGKVTIEYWYPDFDDDGKFYGFLNAANTEELPHWPHSAEELMAYALATWRMGSQR